MVLERRTYRACDERSCISPIVEGFIYCAEHLNHTRQFESGASRDTEHNKLDYEAFLSPAVLQRYAEFMHKNRHVKGGALRDGDNWQKGIPQSVYMKSLTRHFMDLWLYHREAPTEVPIDTVEETLCAILFNTFGYLFEELKDG